MSETAHGRRRSAAADLNIAARPLGHIAELDGLRGLAVIGVLAFHADHLRGGFLGVDLFFVLSGWLITRLLLIETSTTGGVDLMAFWGRRMRRLLPAVLALLVVVSGYAWLWGDTASRVDTSDVGPWAQWYVANWHAIGDAGDYWALFNEPSMFDHLWSLAIEEQFYVVWPVVIALLWRRSPRPERTGWILMTSGVVLATLLAVVLAGSSGATRVYMGTDTRAASILCGAVAAMPITARTMSRLMRTRSGSWVLWLATGAIALMWWRVDGATASWLFRGGLTAHAVLSAIVISGLVARREADMPGLLSRVVTGRGLQRCGRLSYSLYLWHWPVYIVVADRTGLDGWWLTLVRVAATVVVSVIGYQMVEQYVRRRAQWAHGRRGTVSTAVAMTAVSIWWVAIPSPTRTIATLDTQRVLIPAPTTTVADPAPSPDPVASSDPPASAPTPPATTKVATSAAPLPDSLLVVGDSIWLELAVWNAQNTYVSSWDVSVDARLGCGTLSDGSREWCDGRAASWADSVATTQPDIVLMGISHWDAYDIEIAGTAFEYGTAEYWGALQSSWEENLRILQEYGAHVVVSGVPCFSYTGTDDFDLSTRVAPGRTGELNSFGQKFAIDAGPSVSWLDMRELTCPEGLYEPTVQGAELHRDGVHYADAAKPLVLDWVIMRLDDIASTMAEADAPTQTQESSPFDQSHAVTTVLWHGDSVAHDAAPAIVAAFTAMGIEVIDLSFPGSRLTELPNGDDPLERIITAAENTNPQIVFHQLTTWDALAEPIAQRRATERLAELAASINATLVVVTAPVEASAVVDEIDIQRHLAIMTNTADTTGGDIQIWDQSGVFGTTFTIDIDGDGIPERKRDGVHLCPSGAARFAVWLTDATAEMAAHPPADHTAWLGLDWASDDRYDNPPGACEPVPSD